MMISICQILEQQRGRMPFNPLSSKSGGKAHDRGDLSRLGQDEIDRTMPKIQAGLRPRPERHVLSGVTGNQMAIAQFSSFKFHSILVKHLKNQ
jgi:hypothetical protein